MEYMERCLGYFNSNTMRKTDRHDLAGSSLSLAYNSISSVHSREIRELVA